MKRAQLFQNQPVIELTDDENTVAISPDHGARILFWKRQGREIITWPEAADWTQIIKVRGGNPVLFPFVARHFVHGKNEWWQDAKGVVREMPQHGFAKNAKFTVVEDGAENSVRMRLVDSERTRTLYPFAFQFDVVVSLQAGSRLAIRFETTNMGTEALPYYAGHHFYFAVPHDRRADWMLDLPCTSWGRQTPDGSIVHTEATQQVVHLDDSAISDRFQIKPLASTVRLSNEKTRQSLVLELAPPDSAPWFAVTTWSQTIDSDFYCVEPWLGLPNAIHHGEGLRWIEPGRMEMAACILDGSGW